MAHQFITISKREITCNLLATQVWDEEGTKEANWKSFPKIFCRFPMLEELFQTFTQLQLSKQPHIFIIHWKVQQLYQMYRYILINCSAVYNWKCFSGPSLKCTAKFSFEGHIRAYKDACPHPALPTLDSQGRGKRGDCKTAKIHSLCPCPRSVCSQNLEAVCSWRDSCPYATVPAASSSEPP